MPLNGSIHLFCSGLLFFLFALPAFAQHNEAALIDTSGFEKVTRQAFQHRRQRLVNLSTFLELSTQENTLILDTRSASAYSQKHLAGAIHLNFSDFTASKLAALIPDKNTRILIYCNNNFADDPRNFPTKSAPLALNIPTFINLYGYGYTNIYELKDLLSVNNPQLKFSGTAV
jgi:hypothetical protein